MPWTRAGPFLISSNPQRLDTLSLVIRKLLRSLARFAPGHAHGRGHARGHDPKIHKASQIGIDRRLVSSGAIRTVEGLQQAGYKAFVVGGAVRDLMLGLRPKDFDVATDATPEDVQHIFRRARMIGKRFRLVHVLFGPETIEVSTFRAAAGEDHETDAHGRVLRDNTFGEQHEDAARRDLSINALYYDPLSDTVLDYHHGVEDLQARRIRIIGQPDRRYREDPVRMLRVVRFAAKLQFDLESKTTEPIADLADLILNVPQARLFDEMIKLLQSGQAFLGLQQLRRYGLHHGCLPLVDMVLEPEGSEKEKQQALSFVRLALERTDQRVQQGKPISVGFLFASLLWCPVYRHWKQLEAQGSKAVPALHEAIDQVIDQQLDRLSIQKRVVADLREIWMLQPRFEKRNGQAPFRLLSHLRFRAGYDFLLLREAVGQAPEGLGAWWTEFLEAEGEEHRAELVHKTSARRVSPRSSRSESDAPEQTASLGGSATADAQEKSGRPRRRRRSRSAGQAQGGAEGDGGTGGAEP